MSAGVFVLIAAETINTTKTKVCSLLQRQTWVQLHLQQQFDKQTNDSSIIFNPDVIHTPGNQVQRDEQYKQGNHVKLDKQDQRDIQDQQYKQDKQDKQAEAEVVTSSSSVKVQLSF